MTLAQPSNQNLNMFAQYRRDLRRFALANVLPTCLTADSFARHAERQHLADQRMGMQYEAGGVFVDAGGGRSRRHSRSCIGAITWLWISG